MHCRRTAIGLDGALTLPQAPSPSTTNFREGYPAWHKRIVSLVPAHAAREPCKSTELTIFGGREDLVDAFPFMTERLSLLVIEEDR